MNAPQYFHPSRQFEQKQRLQLLHVQWDEYRYYAPPKIILSASVARYTSAVSHWRPVEPGNYLHNAIDLLRDVKRLMGVQNPTLQQAAREALQLAKVFCERWNSNPGLRVQLQCTDRKPSLHVRMFWVTAIAAMALEGQRIFYYEVDNRGITVHKTQGGKRSSIWTNVLPFVRDLKQLPQQPQAQSGTPESESTKDITTLDTQQSSTELRPEVDSFPDDMEVPPMPPMRSDGELV